MSFSRRCSKISIALIAIFILVFGAFFLTEVTASAEGERTLDFSLQVVSPDSEIAPGAFRYISAGDTFTFTYALDANGGLDFAAFFPQYDESAFALTSVSYDEQWVLASEYMYYSELEEEEVVTLEEHLIRYDEEYLASLEDENFIRTYDRMSIEFRSSAFGVYPTSEAFLTLTFTARANYVDAADFVFGFDFVPYSDGGLLAATTNAARYSHYSPVDGGSIEKLLFRMRVGDEYIPMAANPEETSYTAIVVPTISAEIPVGQTLSFVNGVLPIQNIVTNILYPVTPEEGENQYLAEGGNHTLIFYAPDPEDPEAVGEMLQGVPQTEGKYFVQAVYIDTLHYFGITTEPVAITVGKEAIEPALAAFLASEPETAIPEEDKVIELTFTYGDAVTVKDGNEIFDKDNYNTKFYVSADGENWTLVQNDPILTNSHPNAGHYKVTVEPKDPVTQTFGFEEELYTILVTVDKAALTVRANDYTITYGAALPSYSYSLEGKDPWDDDLAIGELLEATLALSTEYDGAGEYVITVSGNAVISNYNVTYVNGTLTVNAKVITLVVSYEGGMATFRLEEGGELSNVLATYKIGETELAGNTYAAQSAYALTADARKAWADAGKNYAIEAVELAKPCRVSYSSDVDAEGIPAEPVYLFAGQVLAAQATDPVAERYDFLYWAANNAEYDFGTALTGDIVLVAKFEKMYYEFTFRAAIFTEAPALAGEMRVLGWDGAKFALSDVSQAYVFEKNTNIPVLSDVKYFKVAKWYKAVSSGAGYTFTEISTFLPEATSEGNSGVLLVACMELDIGAGDVNGDRVVNVDDVLRIRKYVARYDFSAITISTPVAAWAAVTTVAPEGGYLFPMAMDVDEDGEYGLADAIYVTQAIVNGYEYVKVSDCSVNGEYAAGERVIARESVVEVSTGEKLEQYAYLGLNVLLTADLAAEDFYYNGETFLLDLGGNTVTVGSLLIEAKGAIVIQNGTLICEKYIITAAGGITVTGVTGLPAADGSETSMMSE